MSSNSRSVPTLQRQSSITSTFSTEDEDRVHARPASPAHLRRRMSVITVQETSTVSSADHSSAASTARRSSQPNISKPSRRDQDDHSSDYSSQSYSSGSYSSRSYSSRSSHTGTESSRSESDQSADNSLADGKAPPNITKKQWEIVHKVRSIRERREREKDMFGSAVMLFPSHPDRRFLTAKLLRMKYKLMFTLARCIILYVLLTRTESENRCDYYTNSDDSRSSLSNWVCLNLLAEEPCRRQCNADLRRCALSPSGSADVALFFFEATKYYLGGLLGCVLLGSLFPFAVERRSELRDELTVFWDRYFAMQDYIVRFLPGIFYAVFWPLYFTRGFSRSDQFSRTPCDANNVDRCYCGVTHHATFHVSVVALVLLYGGILFDVMLTILRMDEWTAFWRSLNTVPWLIYEKLLFAKAAAIEQQKQR